MEKKVYINNVMRKIAHLGPSGSKVIVSILFSENGNQKWLTLLDHEVLSFFLTEKDISPLLLADDCDELTFENEVLNNEINEINGINLSFDFRDILNSINSLASIDPFTKLLKYAILITTCSSDETESMINIGKDSYVEDIDI